MFWDRSHSTGNFAGNLLSSSRLPAKAKVNPEKLKLQDWIPEAIFGIVALLSPPVDEQKNADSSKHYKYPPP